MPTKCKRLTSHTPKLHITTNTQQLFLINKPYLNRNSTNHTKITNQLNYPSKAPTIQQAEPIALHTLTSKIHNSAILYTRESLQHILHNNLSQTTQSHIKSCTNNLSNNKTLKPKRIAQVIQQKPHKSTDKSLETPPHKQHYHLATLTRAPKHPYHKNPPVRPPSLTNPRNVTSKLRSTQIKTNTKRSTHPTQVPKHTPKFTPPTILPQLKSKHPSPRKPHNYEPKIQFKTVTPATQATKSQRKHYSTGKLPNAVHPSLTDPSRPSKREASNSPT
eukprot:gene2416-1519_t